MPGPTEHDKKIDRAAAAWSEGIDRDANFRILYQAYALPLLRFFANKGCPPKNCPDLTQETFFGIHKGRRAYRHQGRFAAWLFQVATNTYHKHLRTAGAAKRSAQEVSHDEAPEILSAMAQPASQLAAVLDDERGERIREAVAELPPKMRQCMTLHLDHEYTNAEIAIVMKLEVNTVKAHLFQARKKLADLLSDLVLPESDREDEEA